jgi:hypothetical protein
MRSPRWPPALPGSLRALKSPVRARTRVGVVHRTSGDLGYHPEQEHAEQAGNSGTTQHPGRPGGSLPLYATLQEIGEAVQIGPAQAAHALAAAVASVADLLGRQLALLVNEKFNLGLPANLTSPVSAGDRSAGLHLGFKGARIAASALTAEALHLTVPTELFLPVR